VRLGILRAYIGVGSGHAIFQKTFSVESSQPGTLSPAIRRAVVRRRHPHPAVRESHVPADAAKAVKIGVFHGPNLFDTIGTADFRQRAWAMRYRRRFSNVRYLWAISICHELSGTLSTYSTGNCWRRRMERLPLRDSSCVLLVLAPHALSQTA